MLPPAVTDCGVKPRARCAAEEPISVNPLPSKNDLAEESPHHAVAQGRSGYERHISLYTRLGEPQRHVADSGVPGDEGSIKSAAAGYDPVRLIGAR